MNAASLEFTWTGFFLVAISIQEQRRNKMKSEHQPPLTGESEDYQKHECEGCGFDFLSNLIVSLCPYCAKKEVDDVT